MQLPAESHESCASQPVALDEPQLVPDGAIVSRGQAAELPSQASAGLQAALGPATRQTTPAPFTRLTHAPAPSHVSWASHAVVLDDPHVLPDAFGEAALSLHTGAPLPQATMPLTHAPGFVAHAAPGTQGVQAPEPLHTPPAHAEPADFGEEKLSVHTGAPLPQAIAPLKHVLGFVPHPAPAEQGVHAPEPLHTPPVHAARGDFGDERLSAQTATPVPH
jgi:hypothetical protein